MNLTRYLITFALVLSLGGCGYNTLQTQDESVTAAWSEVVNQYQRRFDLVPNLVATVKGYASHEKEVFESVTDARAKVGSITLGADVVSDPEKFALFQQSQAQLATSLSRLLAVAENYPNLKADGAFRDLQAQLEGTENRIAVARNRYIAAVRDFNVTVRSFPTNLTARIFGLSTKQNFAVENEKAVAQPPSVTF